MNLSIQKTNTMRDYIHAPNRRRHRRVNWPSVGLYLIATILSVAVYAGLIVAAGLVIAKWIP